MKNLTKELVFTEVTVPELHGHINAHDFWVGFGAGVSTMAAGAAVAGAMT